MALAASVATIRLPVTRRLRHHSLMSPFLMRGMPAKQSIRGRLCPSSLGDGMRARRVRCMLHTYLDRVYRGVYSSSE